LPILLEGAATQTFAPGGKKPRAATVASCQVIKLDCKRLEPDAYKQKVTHFTVSKN